MRHNSGVSSRPTINRLSGPDERQALFTFHKELTKTCVHLIARLVEWYGYMYISLSICRPHKLYLLRRRKKNISEEPSMS